MSIQKKISVVGFGYWGKNHARVLDELGVLSGVFDLDIKNSNEAKNLNYKIYDSLNEMAEDSDACVIATPAETHYSIAINLIDKLDLLVEKPLSLSVKECKELVSKSKKNKKIVQVGHQLHFHEGVIKMKKLINEGFIGEIKWIYSNRLNMGKIRTEENVMWSFAPHDISLLISLVKSPIKNLSVQGTNLFNQNVEDATLSLFEFENGVKSHIFVSWFHPFKEQRFVVVGTKGTLVFSDTNIENKLVAYTTKIEQGETTIMEHKEEVITFQEREPLMNQAKYFLECLSERTCEINNSNDALKVVEILENSNKILTSI